MPRSVRAGGVSAAVIQDFFDKAVAALKAGTMDAREETTLSCMPITVDETGWRELVQIRDKFVALVLRVHQRSVKRLGEADGTSSSSGSLLSRQQEWTFRSRKMSDREERCHGSLARE